MFPQLGAPIGFLFSGGIFLILSEVLTDEQFFAFGWRIPFVASAVLVISASTCGSRSPRRRSSARRSTVMNA